MRALLDQVRWRWNSERPPTMPVNDVIGNSVEAFSPSNNSPGLDSVMKSLPGHGSCRILDLGPMVAGNFDFFTPFAQRIEIVDLLGLGFGSDHVANLNIDQSSALLKRLIRKHSRSFHLVLAWDLLNYFPYEHGRVLIDLLASLCQPDAKLFAMIVDSETMSGIPNRYRIVDESTLVTEPVATDLRGAPQLAPAAVKRLLKGFRIEHSFVLRHGIREYVAARG